MDCRTPDSVITYTAEVGNNTVTGTNWNQNNGPNNNNGGNGGDASHPGNATTSSYTNNQITLGDNSYQGYQWWVRAIATTTAATNNTSAETEEIAYRTVITLVLNNTQSSSTGTSLGLGDQIWIRGGDAIGSSSIPGFPLTWEDNWNNLSRKRVGTRLMTMISTPALNNMIARKDNAATNVFTARNNGNTASVNHNLGSGNSTATIFVGGTAYTARMPDNNYAQNFTIYDINNTLGPLDLGAAGNGTITFSANPLNTSTWKFITWEINTTAYVDFVVGSDTGNLPNVSWQYGPEKWSYQRTGWANYKDKFPVYPGKHRWCATADSGNGTEPNFSTTKYSREAYSNNNPNDPAWVNTP
jgi:hypothetical protein